MQSKIKVTALKDKSNTTLELFMITPSIAKLSVLWFPDNIKHVTYLIEVAYKKYFPPKDKQDTEAFTDLTILVDKKNWTRVGLTKSKKRYE